MDLLDLDEHIQSRRERYLGTLTRLLKQPSISAQGVGVVECAELVRDLLDEHGVAARLLPTAGAPVVFGERHTGDDHPTILFYGHYDVQPPEPLDAWLSPPFEPTVRDGRIYARGAGDNKGQFLAHMLAIELLADLGRLPTVNVKFILEGEEEVGSPNLPAFVAEQVDLLRADLFYAADGPAHISGRPVVFFGVRGILTMELSVAGANRDLHSGNFGGPVPNAAWRLVELLASMRTADGRVAIDGFYDDVTPPSDYERTLLASIPFAAREFQENLGIDHFDGPAGQAYFEKIMFEPTLTINGLTSGYTGAGSKAVIPSAAKAKLECRLAAGQDPARVFEAIERHVARHEPRAVLRSLGSTRPSKTPPDLPVSRLVTTAVRDAYGVEPVVMPLLGASSPNYLFTDVLGLPAIWVTYGPADENNHAPNENMTLDSFFAGIRASAVLLQRLGTARPGELRGEVQGS